MPVDEPFIIYPEQLSSQYHGLALWDPNPVLSRHVSIGDVGYLDNGTFMRLFNVRLPRNDPENHFIEIPEGYMPIGPEHFDGFRRKEVRQDEYHSHLSKVDDRWHAAGPYELVQTYECRQKRGALLSLPHGARSEDVIRTKIFEDYIRDNVDNWLRWSKKEGLPVRNTEDLILVTGCTLAKSWASAVFDRTSSRDPDAATISLEARRSDGGGVQFFWRNSRGNVEYHHWDSNGEGPMNQCVFIRGFRAKRTLFGMKLIRIGSNENSQRSPYRRNNGLRNTSPSLGDDSHGGSNSSLDWIGSINHENPQRPQRIGDGSPFGSSISIFDSIGSINHENPRRLYDIGDDWPYRDDRPIGSSSSSLDTIGSINHENPQRLQRNGDGSPIGSSNSSLDTIGRIIHENLQQLQRIGDGSPIGGSSSSLDTIGPINPENPQRLQRIGDGSPIGSSSSSLDTIDSGHTTRPPIVHKNSPYRHSTNGSSSLGVGPSFLGLSFLGLGAGRVTNNGLHNIPYVLVGSQSESSEYSSSTILHSNGDLGNASFESFPTSPSDGSLFEDTAEV